MVKALKPRWPREYLSWSQLDCFERSPREYILRYVYGDRRTNPAMELGKRMAEMLEKDTEQDDEQLEFYRTFLPHYPQSEFEIKAEIAGVPLLGKLDGFQEETLEIGEYKTGRNWTQERADSHRQLDFYAMLVWKKYGKLPGKITLHWIPTRLNEAGQPELTGEIQHFETARTLQQVLQIAADAKKAWGSIGRLCAEEFKATGL